MWLCFMVKIQGQSPCNLFIDESRFIYKTDESNRIPIDILRLTNGSAGNGRGKREKKAAPCAETAFEKSEWRA